MMGLRGTGTMEVWDRCTGQEEFRGQVGGGEGMAGLWSHFLELHAQQLPMPSTSE